MSEKRFTTDYSDLLKNDKTFIKMDNERLTYKEIVDLLNELAEENEQLRKELDNFKPVMFQDMQRGTVRLYSKGDVDE